MKSDQDISFYTHRYVKHLLLVTAAGDHCCLATRSEDDIDHFVLVLCNAIGTPMDSKFIEMGKDLLFLTSSVVVWVAGLLS